MKHKPIEVPPFVKVIGGKTYIVESWFDPGAACDLTQKMHKLMDRDLEQNTSLQSPPSELTSKQS